MDPDEAADIIMAAVDAGRPFVSTHPEIAAELVDIHIATVQRTAASE